MNTLEAPVEGVHRSKPMQPKVSLSVILPNFNHGALIARALRALLSQQPAAKEIIVVDDGSTDGSAAVIDRFAERHPSIHFIRNATNQGIIASVRRALAVASGDYLFFGSADDYVLPGLFAHADDALRQYPSAAFFCGRVALVDTDNRVVAVRPFTEPQRCPGYLSPAEVRRAIRGSDFWVIGTATVYRRQLLADVGYFDPRLSSIGDVLTNRLLAFRHGFCFDPAVLAAYNKDPLSFSGRNALSVTESRRLLDAARVWIRETLPEDVRDEHGRLFDRRMRFGLARLWVVWRRGKLDTEAMADILNFGALDRRMLAMLSRARAVSNVLVLGWMTLRLRPFDVPNLIAAWWRALAFKWFTRAAVQREVDKANAPNAPGGAP
jgi:glycosyltransferase involved in cell wall biosynthesis